jgi:hypothetical protein
MSSTPRVAFSQQDIETIAVVMRHGLLDNFPVEDDADHLMRQGRKDAIDFVKKLSDPVTFATYLAPKELSS